MDEPPVETPRFPSPARAHVPSWTNAGALPVRHEFRLNSRLGGDYGIQWTINNEAMDHAAHGAHGLPHDIRQLPEGEWSKLRFANDSFRIHPMHIHGMFFKLLSRNGAPVDEGHFRDTVLVHAKETVEVGVITGPAITIPGFVETLGEHLRLPLEARVVDNTGTGDAGRLTVAAGLAVAERP